MIVCEEKRSDVSRMGLLRVAGGESSQLQWKEKHFLVGSNSYSFGKYMQVATATTGGATRKDP